MNTTKLKRGFTSLSKFVFQHIYNWKNKRASRENLVVFLSRQSNTPSWNFTALGEEFERYGWQVIYHVKQVTRKSLFSYGVHVLKEISLLATCRVAVVDRYDPVVSLLDFECEAYDVPSSSAGHTEFPKVPMVLQLWHAFGAYKKFGFQSEGTLEGHSQGTLDAFSIHRNYSWIVCTGEESRKPFAEAFDYPVDRVIPLGLPEYNHLLQLKCGIDEQQSDTKTKHSLKVLFAPTLRKSSESAHPFHDLQKYWKDNAPKKIEAIWSYHPLEQGKGASTDVSEALLEADVVVTDYSSIVYEAFVLEKPVLFYVPDIDTYRESPGLNADPEILCPEITFQNPNDLKEALLELQQDITNYKRDSLSAFIGTTFNDCDGDIAKRIVDFVLSNLSRTK